MGQPSRLPIGGCDREDDDVRGIVAVCVSCVAEVEGPSCGDQLEAFTGGGILCLLDRYVEVIESTSLDKCSDYVRCTLRVN